ncbi:MAG: DUF4339 domain-containing protein [Nitrospinae bacterium]|nr:DUF4339 domain-containing protein [Nitrospinota bacterium]
MAQWHYVNEKGEKAGPVTEEELNALKVSGAVTPVTMVWAEGMAEWKRLGELGHIPPTPPAPNPPAMNPRHDDRPVKVYVADINMSFGSMVVFMIKWALASIPALIILFMIGGFLMAIFGGMSMALMGMGG